MFHSNRPYRPLTVEPRAVNRMCVPDGYVTDGTSPTSLLYDTARSSVGLRVRRNAGPSLFPAAGKTAAAGPVLAAATASRWLSAEPSAKA